LNRKYRIPNTTLEIADVKNSYLNLTFLFPFRFHLLTEILFLPLHLLQYGCQCQIMTDASLGVAKDSLDESCVGWHQCRTCIKMSTALMTQDEICDPMHSMYPIGVNTTDQSLSCELAGQIRNHLNPKWSAILV